MRIYLAVKVLITDEFDPWPYERTAAMALLALVSAYREKSVSIILMCHKPIAK